MFYRNIQQRLEKSLTIHPVVLLTGARQTGKTTLMKEVAQGKNYTYITFDDLGFLTTAQKDPQGFIQSIPKPVILDEIQRVPELFLSIKQYVDEHDIPGQFALTGSANPLLIPRLGDSLAGRMEILKLFPLSQGELHNTFNDFISFAFSDALFPKTSELQKSELLKSVIVGGYPRVQGLDEDGRTSWFNSYIEALLQRDVKDLSQLTSIGEFPRLLYILATRTGNLLNTADLSRSTGIPTTTLQRYLSLLEALFIVQLQPSWNSNLGNRFIKSPKTYLIDSGLLSFLLGINLQRLTDDGKLMGGILENFVVNELYKQATWSKMRVKLYHFRTTTGIEVDTVLENASGSLVGIEVKGSATINPSDFKGLQYLQEMTQQKFHRGIVLYLGSEIIPYGKGLFAIPLSSLWRTASVSTL